MALEEFSNETPTYTPSRRSEIRDAQENQQQEDRDRLAPTQWAQIKAGTYIAIPRSFQKLSPGFYEIGYMNDQSVFIQKEVKVDTLIRFNNSVPNNVINEIKSFWSKNQIFKEFGFLHRRGYLLYGPAGCGKTAMAQQVIADIIQDDGIVFMCNTPSVFVLGLDRFRQVEPDRPIVCIFEDIDSIIEEHGEDQILALLDGENQVDRVLNIATTNYPEKLNKRLVGRPRRFDRVIRIGVPPEEVRREYFSQKAKLSPSDLELWVKASDRMSFAALAELVISVKCLGNDFDETIQILTDMTASKPSSSEDLVEEQGGAGFAAGVDR